MERSFTFFFLKKGNFNLFAILIHEANVMMFTKFCEEKAL